MPRLFNRELSWLAFNARVLHEAADTRTPLLERLKFLAIFGSNIDEFYMVRVAGIRRQLAAGVTRTGPDGIGPAELLDRIDARVRELLVMQERILQDEVLPALSMHGVRLLRMDELDATERSAVDAFFSTHPLEESRITATTDQIAAYTAAQLRVLRVDEAAFQTMKSRLNALPPSPTPKPVAK